MTLITTPWLLIWWEESHYLDKFKSMFGKGNNIVKLPDTEKPVIIYTDKDKHILHLWRWGWYVWLKEQDFDFNEPKFYRRAQRILWIKYLLQNWDKRKIYKDKRNWHICFVNMEMEYTVILKELPKNYILITWFHNFDSYRYMTKKHTFEEIQTL